MDSFNSPIASDGSVEIEEEYPYRPQPPVIDVRDDAVVRVTWQRLHAFKVREVVAAVGVFAFFASVNLAVCPVLEISSGPPTSYSVPLFVLCGAVLAEGGLLSTCLVFLRGPFWFRAAISWTLGLVLWNCWVIGVLFASWYGRWADVGEVLQIGSLSLPLVALAIQLPLWFVRVFLGWRFTTPAFRNPVNPPLTIRDYFSGTAIAAVSITFARLARPAAWPLDVYWPAWAIAFASFAGGSLVGILPALFLLFRAPNLWIAFGLLLLYALMVAGLVVYVLNAIDPVRATAFQTVALMTQLVSLAIFIGLGFMLARLFGYELETRRTSAPNS